MFVTQLTSKCCIQGQRVIRNSVILMSIDWRTFLILLVFDTKRRFSAFSSDKLFSCCNDKDDISKEWRFGNKWMLFNNIEMGISLQEINKFLNCIAYTIELNASINDGPHWIKLELVIDNSLYGENSVETLSVFWRVELIAIFSSKLHHVFLTMDRSVLSSEMDDRVGCKWSHLLRN